MVDISASQYIAITKINSNYDVSYNINGAIHVINAAGLSNISPNISGHVIDTSGTLTFSFIPKAGSNALSDTTNIIEYIIFKAGQLPNTNTIISIDDNNIYTSGLLTTGEFSLQYNALNNPPDINSIETLYSTFIKVQWSHFGNVASAYKFTLVDATNPASLENVYTYPIVPIGAITLESNNGNTRVYSYILPTPPFGKYTISVGALFDGESESQQTRDESTFLGQSIITGQSSVFSIGELLAYQAEKPLVETQKALLEPALHVVGNKNLRAHSDLVRLNTIEMQTEAVRQNVLQEPYNNINFGSYSDYIFSKVGRLQRNYAL